jgi:hypothetical protein
MLDGVCHMAIISTKGMNSVKRHLAGGVRFVPRRSVQSGLTSWLQTCTGSHHGVQAQRDQKLCFFFIDPSPFEET